MFNLSERKKILGKNKNGERTFNKREIEAAKMFLSAMKTDKDEKEYIHEKIEADPGIEGLFRLVNDPKVNDILLEIKNSKRNSKNQ